MWNHYYSQAKNKWVITYEDNDVAEANSLYMAEVITDGMNAMQSPQQEK